MKDSTMTLLVFAAIVIGIVWFLRPSETPTPGVSPEGIVCQSSTSPVVTFSMVDKYSPASAQSGWIKVRKVGTTSWTTVANGATYSAAPGDELEYLADYNFTSGYAVYGTYTVPCAETALVEIQTADKYTSGITGTFWNSDGQAGTAQAISAGDVKNVEFRFIGTYKKDYGSSDIGYNIFNCKVNSTEIDDFAVPGLEGAAKPSMIATTTGFDDYTYKFPVIESNIKDYKYTASIDADDLVDPANDIVCKLYDTNYDIDADTSAIIQGVQDEDKNNLGLNESAVVAVVTLDLS